ncbi:hypothetical protein GGS20DRAFT_458994 [Poronia punctata]|nr:hypothetical protein GGS20DRAFT_458994 [Poronia punctata]
MGRRKDRVQLRPRTRLAKVQLGNVYQENINIQKQVSHGQTGKYMGMKLLFTTYITAIAIAIILLPIAGALPTSPSPSPLETNRNIYDPCPTGLYNRAFCCEIDLLGSPIKTGSRSIDTTAS